ncbi:hypothetical protein ACWEN6_40275 [Sphaerisporangium sp. NPDC004334]
MSTPATPATEPSPSRLSRLVRSPLTWSAGVLGAVAGALLIAWLPGGGHDLVDRVTESDPLRLPYVEEDQAGDIALERPVEDPEDRATLLTEPEKLPALVREYGGGPVGRLDVVLVAEGGRGLVRVVDIRPRVARTLPVLTGSYLRPDSSGEPEVIHVVSDLDAAERRPRVPGKAGTLYFTGKQIELKRGEQETLRLSFTARDAAYEFDLLATVVADGRTYQQVIRRPDGGMFRVTGAAADHRAYRRIYTGGSSTWHLAGHAAKCTIFPRSKGC